MKNKFLAILVGGISISAMICITLHIVLSPNNVEEVLWDLFDGKEYENTDFEMSELIYHEDMQKPDIISVIYNEHIYGNINRGSIIDEKYVDLSEAIYVEDNKEEPLEAYKIQGISDDYKIAVKIDDIYWGYRTSDYVQPKTLKEYLNDRGGQEDLKLLHLKISLDDDDGDYDSYDISDDEYTYDGIEQSYIYDEKAEIYVKDFLFKDSDVRETELGFYPSFGTRCEIVLYNERVDEVFKITLLGDGLIDVYNGSYIYSYKCELDYISEMLEAIVDNVEGYDVSDENEYQETEIKVRTYN